MDFLDFNGTCGKSKKIFCMFENSIMTTYQKKFSQNQIGLNKMSI